jgi:hypothetical protein
LQLEQEAHSKTKKYFELTADKLVNAKYERDALRTAMTSIQKTLKESLPPMQVVTK